MPETYQTSRRVEFRDTDAAEIMHFSAYFTYMEEVEHEFLRQLGMSVHMRDDQGTISWPRINASCDYYRAVKFEDELEIELAIERLGEKSVRYGFRFQHQGEDVARGKITTVCCRLQSGSPPQSMAVPAWIAEKLQPFVRAASG